jgi:hypothetical protein
VTDINLSVVINKTIEAAVAVPQAEDIYLEVAPRKALSATINLAQGLTLSSLLVKYVSQYTSLAAAISAIGATEETLVIDQSLSLAADAIFPSTLSVIVLKGAVISVPTGMTLTINGPFEAGYYQVFSCTGTGAVSFATGSIKEALVDWWGASTPTTRASSLGAALASYRIVRACAGEYALTEVSASTKEIHMDPGVTFKVPDSTVEAADTYGPAALLISGDDVTIYGDFACNGNYAKQNVAGLLATYMSATLFITGDRCDIRGKVTITDAYRQGFAISSAQLLQDTGDSVAGFRANTIHIVNPYYYAAQIWSVDDWLINSIIVDEGVDSTDPRVRTGGSAAAGTYCSNGRVGDINGVSLVIEENTDHLAISNVTGECMKIEEANNITIETVRSIGHAGTSSGFGIIASTNIQIGSVYVEGYNGSANPSSITGTTDATNTANISINSLIVSGTACDAHYDFFIRQCDGLYVGSVILKDPTGAGSGFYYDSGYATQANIHIGSLISYGHSLSDVITEGYYFSDGTDTIRIDYINPDAVGLDSGSGFPFIPSPQLSAAANIMLTAGEGETIAMTYSYNIESVVESATGTYVITYTKSIRTHYNQQLPVVHVSGNGTSDIIANVLFDDAATCKTQCTVTVMKASDGSALRPRRMIFMVFR